MKFLLLIAFNIFLMLNLLVPHDFNDERKDLLNAIKITGLITYFSPLDKEFNKHIADLYLVKYLQEKPSSFVLYSNNFFHNYLDSTFFLTNKDSKPNWIENNFTDLVFNNYISFESLSNDYNSSRSLFNNESPDTIYLKLDRNKELDLLVKSISIYKLDTINVTDDKLQLRLVLNDISYLSFSPVLDTLIYPVNRYYTIDKADKTYLLPLIKYNESISIDTISLDSSLTLFLDRKIGIEDFNQFKLNSHLGTDGKPYLSNILFFSDVWNKIQHFYYKSALDKYWYNVAVKYLKDQIYLKNKETTIIYLNNALSYFKDSHNQIKNSSNLKIAADILRIKNKLFIRDRNLNLSGYSEIIGINKNWTYFDKNYLKSISLEKIRNELLSINKDDLVDIYLESDNKVDTINLGYNSYVNKYYNSLYINKEFNNDILYLNLCDVFSVPSYKSVNYQEYSNYIIDLRGNINNPILLTKIVGNNDRIRSPEFRVFDILNPNFINYKADTIRWTIPPTLNKDVKRNIFLLVNNNTFSSGETTCSILRENFKNCLIIGHLTSGSNGTVDFLDLRDDYILTYTTSEVLYNIKVDQNNRIYPDFIIPEEFMLNNLSKDPYIEFVLELIENSK